MCRASDVLRLGIIGLGGASMQMLPSLIAHPRIQLAACAELNVEARNRFAADFGATPYREAEALCADPAVEAVYISSPHRWHPAHAVMAAEAGKHVVVEKPMALTLEDCDTMIEAANRNGVWMVVGHTHSFDAPILKMREIIRSGDLGPVAMINTFAYSNFLYRPRNPEELRTEEGGGIIFNQVPHQIDVVRYLGGGMLRSVRGMAWRLAPERPTEGSHATFLQFEDGAAAMLVYSGYDRFDSDEFHGWIGELGEPRKTGEHGAARARLQGLDSPADEAALKRARGYAEKPMVRTPSHHPHCGVTIVSCADADMQATPGGITIYGPTGKVEVPVPIGSAFPDKAAVFDELLVAIDRDQEPIHNGRWGKATMEASLAVLASARSRQEIRLRYQVPVAD